MVSKKDMQVRVRHTRGKEGGGGDEEERRRRLGGEEEEMRRRRGDEEEAGKGLATFPGRTKEVSGDTHC